jgi:SAM-dependent methyltransferase
MEEYGPSTFGELNADDYDRQHDPGTTDATVAVIAELAGRGAILELAIGTGRIALPLARAGHRISGIDASPEMVARLRAKPGGAGIPVTIGDFAEVGVPGPFDHVFLVFNTLFNLTSQEAQVRCFRNVARRLVDGGTFLVETFVPDPAGFPGGARLRTRAVSRTTVQLEAATHDPVRQLVEYQRITITEGSIRLVPLPMRYAWPAEIDLMARLAGLSLVQRWGGWDRRAFDAESVMHVSVYQKRPA